MIRSDQNQPFHGPQLMTTEPNFNHGNPMPMNTPIPMQANEPSNHPTSSSVSCMRGFYLPALLLFWFAWILHGIATFIPYWSVYSPISGSRAGLWSARYFDYTSIQNFYVPELTDFPNLTNSVRFTTANTKGYLVTVQFLMTFNFTVMFIVLVCLTFDYIASLSATETPRSFLIRNHNTSETPIKFGLLLYIIYVFGSFEFAAWITYIVSRSDNNWKVHVSFVFTIIVSALLIVVFILYVIEFLKTFKKNRSKWEYWYGPYIEWGFFIFLSALLLLLLVICCPEWAYTTVDQYSIFAEIGLFKQCYLSQLYKKSSSPEFCTLSSSSSNKSWVDATQAFMLMAYIIGMFLLLIIIIYRREFRHNEKGYNAERCGQPTFTFIVAGVMLFFCFVFSLIGVSIFGSRVFKYPLTVNWGYILAIIAMTLFLIAGVLFIMDGIHSEKQTIKEGRSVLFPEPLSSRVLNMEPLLHPDPPNSQIQTSQPPGPLQAKPLNVPPRTAPSMFHPFTVNNIPPQPMTAMPPYYGVENYSSAPFTQTALVDYFRKTMNDPELSKSYGQGLMNHPGFASNRRSIYNSNRLNDLVREHALQQQRLEYNHERLLERYSRLAPPRVAEFHVFGSSSLPGRNYDEYLRTMSGNRDPDNSTVIWSRGKVASPSETYRAVSSGLAAPLPKSVTAAKKFHRNESQSYVDAEKHEPFHFHSRVMFNSVSNYIRSLRDKLKHSNPNFSQAEIDLTASGSNSEPETDVQMAGIVNSGNRMSNPLIFENMAPEKWQLLPLHLLPRDGYLSDMYNLRIHESIEIYGQSLYTSSARYIYNIKSNLNEDDSLYFD